MAVGAAMEINADFSKRAVIRPGDVDWVHSPASGVDRMMLDRIGDEVARQIKAREESPALKSYLLQLFEHYGVHAEALDAGGPVEII